MATLRGDDDDTVIKRVTVEYFKPRDSDFTLIMNGSRDGLDHLGVYFWLSKESGRDINTILKLRLEGLSWSVVFGRVGVDIGRVFITLPRDPGPPYGKAYGYWRHGPGSRGRTTIVLTDAEICDWVNARSFSVALGIDAGTYLERRGRGEAAVVIAGKTYREKHGKGNVGGAGKKNDTGHGGGKGKGKNK
jgi:hypothetical protein